MIHCRLNVSSTPLLQPSYHPPSVISSIFVISLSSADQSSPSKARGRHPRKISRSDLLPSTISGLAPSPEYSQSPAILSPILSPSRDVCSTIEPRSYVGDQARSNIFTGDFSWKNFAEFSACICPKLPFPTKRDLDGYYLDVDSPPSSAKSCTDLRMNRSISRR